jgi:hypothetical protein
MYLHHAYLMMGQMITNTAVFSDAGGVISSCGALCQHSYMTMVVFYN